MLCCWGASGAAAEPPRYTLFAGGDTMLARWIPQYIYQRGVASAFAGVRDDIAGADLALTNLESVVSSRGDFFAKGGRRPFYYRGPPDMINVLSDAGFDLVTTANNHAMDFGGAALAEQLELLAAANIVNAGSGLTLDEARRPAYLRVGELVVAVIAMEDANPSFAARPDRAGVYHVAQNRMLATLRRAVAEARVYADLVVFSPHWGPNWTDAPSALMRRIARGFIDAGGDALLGHSSHLVHGVELYRGKPIVYDLGSLYFDTIKTKRMRWTAGWLLEFDAEGFKRLTVRPYRLSSGRTRRAVDDDDVARTVDFVIDASRALDPDIEWRRDGADLIFDFAPQRPARPRRRTPPDLAVAGRTRPLPTALSRRVSNVVATAPPARFAPLREQRFDNGVRALGFHGSEAVRPHYGFVFELLVRAPGALAPRWVAVLEGVNRRDGQRFRWRHPFADGAWTPERWRPDQYVIDRTFVRPYPPLSPGTYDLYWGMENRRDGSTALLLDDHGPTPTRIPAGVIEVLDTGIPALPSGVDWDGKRR